LGRAELTVALLGAVALKPYLPEGFGNGSSTYLLFSLSLLLIHEFLLRPARYRRIFGARLGKNWLHRNLRYGSALFGLRATPKFLGSSLSQRKIRENQLGFIPD